MTTNQPPRKTNLMSILIEVESGVKTPEEAAIEIESLEQDDTES